MVMSKHFCQQSMEDDSKDRTEIKCNPPTMLKEDIGNYISRPCLKQGEEILKQCKIERLTDLIKRHRIRLIIGACSVPIRLKTPNKSHYNGYHLAAKLNEETEKYLEAYHLQ